MGPWATGFVCASVSPLNGGPSATCLTGPAGSTGSPGMAGQALPVLLLGSWARRLGGRLGLGRGAKARGEGVSSPWASRPQPCCPAQLAPEPFIRVPAGGPPGVLPGSPGQRRGDQGGPSPLWARPCHAGAPTAAPHSHKLRTGRQWPEFLTTQRTKRAQASTIQASRSFLVTSASLSPAPPLGPRPPRRPGPGCSGDAPLPCTEESDDAANRSRRNRGPENGNGYLACKWQKLSSAFGGRGA